jgi:hypothetical protein
MPGIAVSPQRSVRKAPSPFALREPSFNSVKIAVGAIALAWIPLVCLCALAGTTSLRSFLLDYAAQSRLLVVIPVLIVTEPALVKRLDLIARHFLEDRLITDKDRPKFEEALTTLEKLGSSLLVQFILLASVLAVAVLGIAYVQTASFMTWCYSQRGEGSLSLAGSWYVLVSLPMVLYLLLRWIWRQILWGWFLGTISRMKLNTIPAHPDKVAGLGFVETCHRKYIPFSFAVSTIVAGGIANRVLHEHRPLTDFRLIPAFVIAVVITVFAAPLCVLFSTLLDAKRRGTFEYGALATSVGREFEQKWLVEDKEKRPALEVQDFSATIDLYSVVANVDAMRAFPFKTSSLSRLAIWSVVPWIPIALASLPLEIVLKRLIKLVV